MFPSEAQPASMRYCGSSEQFYEFPSGVFGIEETYKAHGWSFRILFARQLSSHHISPRNKEAFRLRKEIRFTN